MQVARLVLDYIGAFLEAFVSWPFALGVVSLLLILKFRPNIARLIDSVTEVALNWGGNEAKIAFRPAPPDSATPAPADIVPNLTSATPPPPAPGKNTDSILFDLGSDTVSTDLPSVVAGDDHEARLNRGILRIRNGAVLIPGGRTTSFIARVSFRILSDYGKPSNWLGLLIGANNPLLGSGWLIYWRSNGLVEVYSPELDVVVQVDPRVVPRDKVTLEVVGERERIVVWAYAVDRTNSMPLFQKDLPIPLWQGHLFLHSFGVDAEISELKRWVRRG